MKKILFILVFVTCLSGFINTNGQAATSTYNDFSSFENQVSNLNSWDLEEQSDSSFSFTNLQGPGTITLVKGNMSYGTHFGWHYDNSGVMGNYFYMNPPASNGDITFDSTYQPTAFGISIVWYGSYNDDDIIMNLYDSNNQLFDSIFILPENALETSKLQPNDGLYNSFIGVTTDIEISRVDFVSTAGGSAWFDNPVWGDATPTPIPSTIGLLSFGLLGLAGVSRKRKQ